MKLLALFLLTLSLAAVGSAQVKKPEPAAVMPRFEDSLQAVVVTTADENATTGKAQFIERKSTRDKWKTAGDSFAVVVGRSGLAWGEVPTHATDGTKIKQEGDGNAPAGHFPLTSAFGTSVKPEAVGMPYTKLEEFTECVDDTNSRFYNRIVNRMQVGMFDWKSSEKMLAVGDPYGLGLFVAYNSFPVTKGRGSCIFMHVWESPTTATEGCTAMQRQDLERVVAWLEPSKNPYLIQFTSADYAKDRKTWKLPKMK